MSVVEETPRPGLFPLVQTPPAPPAPGPQETGLSRPEASPALPQGGRPPRRGLSGWGLRRLALGLFRTVVTVLRWVLVVALAGVVVGAVGAVVVGVAGYMVGEGAVSTPTKAITLDPLAVRSVVYARDGSVLAELHAEEDRVPVPLDKVPPHVVRAVLDAEDERFFDHGPLDYRSLLRAAVTNVEAGGVTEGGSTITQQLVKLELLTAEQDLDRKLKEAVLAIQLERQYTKSEILERYLNRVYFGNGAYGIEAAAQRYYGTGASNLTLGQAVLLAGVIRYPVGSDPLANPAAARERRDVIVDRMQLLGHIDAEQAAQIKAEALPLAIPPVPPRSSDYFTEAVKQELLGAEWLGATPEDRYRAVFAGGLKVHTTLDPRAQQLAQDSVSSILPEDRRGFTASLVSVEPSTGAVRALVGGPNFDKTKFNLVTDGDGRQVGSAFKMVTLVAAVESGILPIDIISGSEPCPIDNPGSADRVWSPRNVEGGSAGTLTLAGATISSVNCAYARLIKLVGPAKVVEVAGRMGITNPLGAHLSLTLGSEPVTPLQIATAYATLANEGVRNRPYFVERVEGGDGRVVFGHAAKPERALAVEHARIVTEVLVQTVSSGTGRAAAIPGRPVGGKTGSTDENADAWFVGFTPQLSTAVWMGAPESRVSMYNVGAYPRVYGGTYPAMMFGAYMKAVLEPLPVGLFVSPPPPNRGPNVLSVPAPPPAPTPPRAPGRR